MSLSRPPGQEVQAPFQRQRGVVGKSSQPGVDCIWGSADGTNNCPRLLPDSRKPGQLTQNLKDHDWKRPERLCLQWISHCCFDKCQGKGNHSFSKNSAECGNFYGEVSVFWR